MKLEIKDNSEELKERLQSMERLGKMKVKVGLPASAGAHLHFILAIQEHGAPVMRIPSRRVVGPALENESTREKMAKAMVDALRSSWDGEPERAYSSLEEAGQAGADGIRKYIDAGISPPNSPVTVSGGWIWNRIAKKGVFVAGKGFNKPLYDTGELYNAFGYEITEE